MNKLNTTAKIILAISFSLFAVGLSAQSSGSSEGGGDDDELVVKRQRIPDAPNSTTNSSRQDDSKNNEEAAERVFKPTEEISEDLPVPFPVDI